MLEDMKPIQFKPDQVIFNEGDAPDAVYLIEKGEVEICRQVSNEKQTLKILGWNDIFGEMSLVDEKPRNATAVAKNEVWCYKMDKEAFTKKLDEIDPFMRGIYKSLTKLINENNATKATNETDSFSGTLEMKNKTDW